jgi:hypothetical protein
MIHWLAAAEFACFNRRAQAHEKMNQLIKSLPVILRAAGGADEVAEAAAIAAWKHAAGAGLKEHAIPLKLENRTLTVAVADAIWQKQLTSMRSRTAFSNQLNPGPAGCGRARISDRFQARATARRAVKGEGSAARQQSAA